MKSLVDNGFRDILGHADAQYWNMHRSSYGIHIPDYCEIGITLWGDEGDINGKWMFLQWGSDNAPFHILKDSMASRFPITLIDSHAYVLDEENNTNITLQAALGHVRDSFDILRQVFSACPAQLVGIRGDWKYLCQALALFRTPHTNQICFQCLASKDMSMPYTDITESAAWRSTFWSVDPCLAEPTILQAQGSLSLRCAQVDIMHTFHLGIGRDLVGSTLCLLLRSRARGPFAGSNLKRRLRSATRMLKQFIKTQPPGKEGTFPRKWEMKKAWVGMAKTSVYVECRCKAAQCATLVQWLTTLLPTCDESLIPLELRECFTYINRVMRVLFEERKNGHLLPQDLADQVHTLGYAFATIYLRMHVKYKDYTYRLYNPRPKYHMLCHMLDEIKQTRRNVARSATFMDEDWLKKFGMVLRKTHVTTATKTTLQRYLAGLPPKLQKLLGTA